MTDTTLTRLRSANPVPEVPEVSEASKIPATADRELFARITATPGDVRLRPRRRVQRRRVVTIAVAFGALLAATAPFAITKLTSQSGPIKGPAVRREYQQAQHQLTLPPGYRWPNFHWPSHTVTGVGMGSGEAVLIDQTDWECYWVTAIRHGDAAAQQQAHGVLWRLLHHNMFTAPPNASENWTLPNPPTYPYVVMADDGGWKSLERTYEQAAAGHPQQLIESCRANRS